jgi:biopolymer transport protein ExbD
MSLSSKKRSTFDEINITPLTDIFLVLLIIMMVIAPLLDQQGLNLLVPSEHQAKQQEKESKIITIEVSDKDEYLLDGKIINVDVLLPSIKELYQEKKDGLLIKADNESTHGAVVKIMDVAQNIGIKNISVFEK